MPEPRKGEKKSDYINRFMGSAEAKRDFPDPKQRVAVAHSMHKRKKK